MMIGEHHKQEYISKEPCYERGMRLRSMQDERRLTGNTDPHAMLSNPGIDEALAERVRFSILLALLFVNAGHDHAVAIGAGAHRLTDNVLGA